MPNPPVLCAVISWAIRVRHRNKPITEVPCVGSPRCADATKYRQPSPPQLFYACFAPSDSLGIPGIHHRLPTSALFLPPRGPGTVYQGPPPCIWLRECRLHSSLSSGPCTASLRKWPLRSRCKPHQDSLLALSLLCWTLTLTEKSSPGLPSWHAGQLRSKKIPPSITGTTTSFASPAFEPSIISPSLSFAFSSCCFVGARHDESIAMRAFHPAAGHVQRASFASLRLVRHRANRRLATATFARHLASVAAGAKSEKNNSLARM